MLPGPGFSSEAKINRIILLNSTNLCLLMYENDNVNNLKNPFSKYKFEAEQHGQLKG